MQGEHGDAESRDEHSAVDAREGAVRPKERERGSREGRREKERAGQRDTKRDEDRTQPSDAEGDERRATEKRPGSGSRKSREVGRQTSRDVLDLQPRDEEHQKEGRDSDSARGAEEPGKERRGAQDDHPEASGQQGERDEPGRHASDEPGT